MSIRQISLSLDLREAAVVGSEMSRLAETHEKEAWWCERKGEGYKSKDHMEKARQARSIAGRIAKLTAEHMGWSESADVTNI
jgi:hypothetical protein